MSEKQIAPEVRPCRKRRRVLHPTPDETRIASRGAQGLPPYITDEAFLAHIEYLVCSALGYGYWTLEPDPEDLETGGVSVPAFPRATDDDLIDHRGDDGALPLHGHQLPLFGEPGPVGQDAL